MSKIANLVHDLPDPGDGEHVNTLASGTHTRVERIVSMGHSSPPGFWYDQTEDEWVTVISGEAELEFADPPRSVRLRPGDHVNIPAHQRHRVGWTSATEPTIWIAVFYQQQPANNDQQNGNV